MSESNRILLTVEQVEEWEQEATRLAHRIAEDQAQLDNLRQKLKYADYFRPKTRSQFTDFFGAQGGTPLVLSASASTPSMRPTQSAGGDSGDLTAAIERIANASPRPIAKKALKAALAGEGFAADRLANYFYTAIHRLKGKDRITVLDDGSVWKAPAVLEANSN